MSEHQTRVDSYSKDEEMKNRKIQYIPHLQFFIKCINFKSSYKLSFKLIKEKNGKK